MDKKSELYALWQTQEALLQQYRSMAVTMLGIIAAGVLVLICFLAEAIFDKQRAENIGVFLAVSLFCILGVLIRLGFQGIYNFKRHTAQRALMISFYQNCLISIETGKMESFLSSAGLVDLNPTYASRVMGSCDLSWTYKKFCPDTSSGNDYEQSFWKLYNSINAWASADVKVLGKYSVRVFLQDYLYQVYSIFYWLSLFVLLLISGRWAYTLSNMTKWIWF